MDMLAGDLVSFTTVVAVILGTFSVIAMYFIRAERRVFANLPPRWRNLPIVGNVKNTFFSDANFLHLELTEACKELGSKLVSYRQLGSYVVAINDYQNMKELMVDNGGHSSGRLRVPSFTLLGKMFQDLGFTFADGPRLYMYRRKLMALMHKFGYGASDFEAKIKDEAVDMCESILEAKTISPEKHLLALTTKMIVMMAFGKVIDRDDPKLKEILWDLEKIFAMGLNAAVQWLYPYEWMLDLPLVGSRRTKEFFTCVTDLLQKISDEVEEKEKENQTEGDGASTSGSKQWPPQYHQEPMDMLGVILELKSENGEKLRRAEICGMFENLLVAGIDTTATSLLWLTVHMAENPDMQESVFRELCGVEKDVISLSDLEQLPYTNAVIHEAIRFGATLPQMFPHRVTAPFTSKSGHFYPQDTILLGNLWAVLHDPDVWEKPDQFWPGHFLDSDGAFVNREEFVAFGLGPRSCVAKHLARIEVAVGFTTMVRNMRFVKPKGSRWDLSEAVSGFSRKPLPYEIHFEKRE